MSAPRDIILDDDLDILIASGDFVIDDVTVQNQYLLLKIQKGEEKQYPKAGVGLQSYLLDEAEQEMMREIRSQFESDGMEVNSLVVTDDGKINIDAPYSS